jgi:hypothetical protein
MKFNSGVVFAILLASAAFSDAQILPQSCPTLSIISTGSADHQVTFSDNFLIGGGTAIQTASYSFLNQNILTNPNSFPGWTTSVPGYNGTGVIQAGTLCESAFCTSLVLQAQENNNAARICLLGRPATSTDIVSTVLNGTIPPGIYDFSQFMTLSSAVVFDGLGSPDSIFVLRAPRWTISSTGIIFVTNRGNVQNLYFIATQDTINILSPPGITGHFFAQTQILIQGTNGAITASAPSIANSNSAINGLNCTVNACFAPITPPTAPVAPVAPVAPPSGPSYSCPALGPLVTGYAVLSQAKVTVNGISSAFSGSVASAFGTVTGIPPATITDGVVQNGTSTAVDALASAGAIQLCIAPYVTNSNCTVITATQTTGNFTPGVYCLVSGTLTFNGVTTLNGQNSSGSIFTFIAPNIVFGSTFVATLTNATAAGNIAWSGTNAVTINSGAQGAGNVFSGTSMTTGVNGSTIVWNGGLYDIRGTGANFTANVTVTAQNCTAASFCYNPIAAPTQPPPVVAPLAPPVMPAPVVAPALVPTEVNELASIFDLAIVGIVLAGVALAVAIGVMCVRMQ